MESYTLKHGLVFTENCRFEPLDVAFSGGVITDIAPDIQSGEVIDCKGCYLLPGLVDIHLHGCMGHDVCDGDTRSLSAIAGYEFSHGVTAFCPTTMTIPDDRLKAVLMSLKAYTTQAKMQGKAKMIGVHLEGPFVSKDMCGAQSSDSTQLPSAEKLMEYQSLTGGLIRLVTVAPEIEGAAEMISECGGEFHFSLGHTAADYDTAKAALAAGADHITHLFNAMPPFHHRETGVIGAAFDEGKCYAELICDGVHISPTAVRAAFKLFGDERIILISDSMEGTGMPDGSYTLGGQRVFKRGAQASLENGTLAGSVTNLYGCMKTAVSMGIPLESAVRAATINPARSVGCDDRFGSIVKGKAAHFVIADKADLSIKRVI